ncbi:hypothetical protein P3T76_009346 [Phytophthora citrophthora]|uniref:Uncharacterized protein n=1 Tax=Phytophthora citrophthora TaxID=4793 RepID=A0AAD9LJ37_9STRA|nr:hypothetical protein P3T76_009346 [Phytophthora citrophthora]
MPRRSARIAAINPRRSARLAAINQQQEQEQQEQERSPKRMKSSGPSLNDRLADVFSWDEAISVVSVVDVGECSMREEAHPVVTLLCGSLTSILCQLQLTKMAPVGSCSTGNRQPPCVCGYGERSTRGGCTRVDADASAKCYDQHLH